MPRRRGGQQHDGLLRVPLSKSATDEMEEEEKSRSTVEEEYSDNM